MSTKVTTLYDAFVTAIGSVLPQHTRLSNPYKPEENPDLLKKKGWGVRVGPGTNTNRVMCPETFIARTFTVVITRLYEAREGDGAAKAVTEKQLAEDAILMVKYVEANQNIGGASTSGFVSDNGIEYVQSDTDKFLKIELEFQIEYFETLT
jgi:hypothetical protein